MVWDNFVNFQIIQWNYLKIYYPPYPPFTTVLTLIHLNARYHPYLFVKVSLKLIAPIR